MSNSQNGWIASRQFIKTCAVTGTTIKLPIRQGDVTTVLEWVAQQFNNLVQKLHEGWCWGFAPRNVRGSTTVISNHASGTAIDLNAPNFPRGAALSKVMTPAMIAGCRKIVKALKGAVRWGGDYKNAPIDAMHFEINCGPAFLKTIADQIRRGVIAMRTTTTKLQKLQTLLGLPADNIWGPRTEAAAELLRQEAKDPGIRNVTKIKAFQKIVGTTSITGKWGSQTDSLYLALRKAHKK